MATVTRKGGIGTMQMYVWSGVQKFGVTGLAFVSNIVLARLLTPSDFGCIGMLAIFIAVASLFVEGGLGSALIQKSKPSDKDYSTIFFWNIGVSTGAYLVLYCVAPMVSRFYSMPQLINVLRVEGLMLVLSSFGMVQTTIIRKRLQFQLLAKINLTATVISVITAVVMAFNGFGIWSIVAQQLMLVSCISVFSWIVQDWRPKFCFSIKALKEMLGYGVFLLLSNIINTICNNVQGLLIGRFYTAVDMGYYSQAKKLEEVPSTTISGMSDQVTFPLLAEMKDDKNKLIEFLRKIICSISFVTTPIMLFLCLCARPVITIVFSDVWIPAVPYFQILCFAGIASCLQTINYYAVAALGDSSILFKWTIIKRLLALACVLCGIPGGIVGIVIGSALGAYVVYFCNAWVVSKRLGYRIRSQVMDLMPILLVNLSVFISCWIIIEFFELTAPVTIGFIGLLYILMVLIVSKLCHIQAMANLVGLVRDVLARNRGRKQG